VPPRKGQRIGDVPPSGDLRRVERLLALLLLATHKDDTVPRKVSLLRLATFSAAEVGELLGMDARSVTRSHYEATSRTSLRQGNKARARKGKPKTK
jgi:hypothetical protein